MKLSYLIDAWLVLLLAVCFGAALAGVQIGLGPRIAYNKRMDTLSKVPTLMLSGQAVVDVRIDAEQQAGESTESNKPVRLVATMVDGSEIAFQARERQFEFAGSDGKATQQTAIEAQRDGKRVGWVVPAVGDGYADKIELLIGLSADASQIMGIDVLSQKETPALGDNIKKPDFRDQFAGRSVAKALGVKNDGGEIQAITSATISSRSVCKIVNDAVVQWKAKLAAMD